MIPKRLFDFLRDLAANNNRDWFEANKPRYRADVVEPVSAFIAAMAPRIEAISPHIVADPRPNGGSMFRIYRDTRFSRDKTPYKTHVGCQFRHTAGKDAHAPGYYVHLGPGEVFFGGGIWMPPAPMLHAVRQRIVDKPKAWTAATGALSIRGEQLTRAPKGFDAAHPLEADLRRKSFFAMAEGSEALAASDAFETSVAAQFEAIAPLMRFIAGAAGLPF
jgi:uncharacterized protein (TIGR02453 family)